MREVRWWILFVAFGFALGGCDSTSSSPDGGDGTGDVEEEDGAAEGGSDVEDIVEETDTTPPPLVWGECITSQWPAGYPLPAAGVECTAIDVPIDHSNPAAGTIALNVGRQMSRNYPTGKAVFHLAGGPGGASLSQSGIIPRIMPELLPDFDLVYVDQRGTGQSGYMACPGGYPETLVGWTSCAARWASRDLNHYLTVDAAHDLDAVRRRLGYDRITIRGGSYGTRLGLEYLRQHGDTVVAAVLDGLAPPDVDLFAQGVTVFDHGVDLLVADCAADPACIAVSPDLHTELHARRDELRATPRPIFLDTFADVEDEATFLMFFQAFLYDAYWRYDVPRAIHQAALGDNTRWNALMSDASGTTVTDRTKSSVGSSERAPFDWIPRRRVELAQDYVSPGLFITVVCAEWLPNSTGADALRTLLATQEWRDDTHIVLADACPAWSVDPVDASLRQAVTSDVPTLLMNGEIDLNTPQEWGPHAALTLSNGTSLLVPYASHSTMSVPCAAQIMSRFIINDGRIEVVDTSCLSAILHPGW